MLTKLKVLGFETHVGIGDVVGTRGKVEVQACKGCRSPNGLPCGSSCSGVAWPQCLSRVAAVNLHLGF
jgi:hypothetical protein